MTKQTDDLTKQYCRDYEKATGHLPLIFDQFIYQLPDRDDLKIVAINSVDEAKCVEVLLQDRDFNFKHANFSELMVKP